MKKNEKDTFEGLKQNISQNNNFFMNEKISTPDMLLFSSEPLRRLNDYDSNLLQEDAYKDVQNNLFKLEYKIFKIEEEIKLLNSQIISAQEIGDSNLAEEFFIRKLSLEREYQNLLDTYNNNCLSAKISSKFSNIFDIKTKKNYKKIQPKLKNLYKSILNKLPRQITSLLELKQSLSKLKNINKSVDELMSMNIPYGENINKYDQLSKYIIKANSIQSHISQQIK